MSHFIGIDASTSSTGYAVLDKNFKLIEKDVIKAKADDPQAFASLYLELVDVLMKYQPKYLICEQQFVGRNMNTSIKLARPTGVVLAAAGLLKDCEFEFLVPASWRKIYHTGTDWEKKYSKKHSFEVTKERYPGVVSNFNKHNDISDAIGIAYAAVVKHNEAQSAR